MSDPKDLPPDDFSATTPNIKISKSDTPEFGSEPANDWEKTNYNYALKEQKEEWNKTSYNSPKISSQPDSNKLPAGNEPQWGATQVNINLPGNQQQNFEDVGAKRAESRQSELKFQTPREDRPTFQEPIREIQNEKSAKKAGVTGWFWTVAGLLGMFVFAVAVLLAVYLFFLNKTGYEVAIKGVPVKSDVVVDGSNWGVTYPDGTIRLQSLRAGETKKIEVRNPNFKCDPIEIKAENAKNGAFLQETVRCGNSGAPIVNNQGSAPPECLEIKKGDYSKAAKCAYDELDKLEKGQKAGTMFTADQLLYAMNLYIVNFDSGKFSIKPNDMTFVARASGFMKQLPPTTMIEIGGHTDNVGQDAKNQPLSENRAKAVEAALVQFGVNPGMLQIKGYGKSKPRETNDTEDGRFRNRRIEYTAVSK